MRRFFLLIAAVLTATVALAQTADWLVLPEYQEIKYFGPEMYKVKKNGKVGILGTNGKVILQPEYDAINYFYDGRSIFVDKTDKGWLLRGVLTEEGEVTMASGTYYLTEYMFFSDGLLPVRAADGTYGYLNEECRLAFGAVPAPVHPFSEGYAAVGEGDTFCWIDTSGEPLGVRLSNGGTPYAGTNFYNGKAYLNDEDGVCFSLDAEGRTRKVNDYPSYNTDYLFRIGTSAGSSPKYSQYEMQAELQWEPQSRDGRWTFVSSNGTPLTPFQYDEVGAFCNGAAVAAQGGRYGLIHIVEDNSTFYASAQNTSKVFSAGASCDCSFNLSVPEKWAGEALTVLLKDSETGQTYSLQRSGQHYTFSYKPSGKKEQKKFLVEVKNKDIKLWSGTTNYSFKQKIQANLQVSLSVATDANSNNRCSVTATISNPSDEAVTTTVRLTGGGTKASFNSVAKKVTIPAYGKRTVSSSFLVQKAELNGWCSATTDHGGSARRNGLQLRPF